MLVPSMRVNVQSSFTSVVCVFSCPWLLYLFSQVRDMTGDGQVCKKRIREGTGEFPVDCPLHDTRVRCHYRVRQLPQASNPGPWAHDTTQSGAADAHHDGSGAFVDSSWADAAVAGGDGVIEVDTGCGDLPDGLEMCLKLMVPGEVASVTCSTKYAYEVRYTQIIIGCACADLSHVEVHAMVTEQAQV